MASTTAQAVLQRASILLVDSEQLHWPADELLGYLGEGQREYARLKPSAYVKRIDFQLQLGTTQQLPADASALLDIPRNKGGIRIRQIARRALDSQVRDWASPSRAKAVVAHFCYEKDNPLSFEVYPPSPGGNLVELEYYAIPPDPQLSDRLALSDSAIPALLDYIFFRAFAKDAEFAANDTRVATHYRAFYAAATGKAPALSPPDA